MTRHPRKGATGVLFALLLIPLLLTVGAAVDFGRVYLDYRTLQNAVDASALAGASAYTDPDMEQAAVGVAQNYFSRTAAAMPQNLNLSAPNIAASATASCAPGGTYSVSVSASATVPMTLMSMFTPSVPISATATARNPMVVFTFNVAGVNFNPIAGDWDTVYWYKVPSDGSLPALSDLQLIASNGPQSDPLPTPAGPITVCTSNSEQFGFALSDSPAAHNNADSHTNQYGGTFGNTYYYYSQLYPPSLAAYPNQPTDCALQIVQIPSGGSPPPPVTGQCFDAADKPYTSLASDGVVSCAALDGTALEVYWNDMGDGSTLNSAGQQFEDDLNYTDVDFAFQCAMGAATQVYLAQ
jgi:Flp pilus assembly protein TadG